jgi:type VI secretion system secreted protein Hcp
MAFDAFLKIEGIDGESSDDKHASQVEVLSYSHHVAQQGGASTSRVQGQTGARADLGDLSVVKVIDKASPNLFKYCVAGTHIPTVVLELCAAAGDKHTYMKYTLSDCVVSSVRPGGSSGCDGVRPLEEVAFRYAKIELEYTPFDNKGKPQAAVKGGWDLATNKAL